MFKPILCHLILAFLFLSACNNGASNSDSTQKQGPPALTVEGKIIRPQHFEKQIQSTAELLPNEQVELVAPVAGQVLNVYFKEGQYIKKGAPIIRIDDRAWRAEVQAQRALLASKSKDYKRKKSLLAIEGSRQEDIDVVYADMKVIEATIEKLQINIGLATVRAPFSGQMGMRNFSRGSYLQVGDAISTITETNQLKVDFTVPQEQVRYAKVGQAIQVVLENDTFHSRIYAVSPFAEMNSRSVQVRARLQQQFTNQHLPGSFAEVILASEKIEDAILVPSQAIVPRINEQTVYIAKNGKAQRVTVTLGNRTPAEVLVTSGLSVGDTVITTGLLMLKDSMSLNFKKVL